MNLKGTHNVSGLTIVEIMVSIIVMSVGLIALMTSLDRGTSFARAAITTTHLDAPASKPLRGLVDAVAETSIAHVDTTMRVAIRETAIFFDSDRFPMFGIGLSQCTSAVCSFHTRPDFSIAEHAYNCGYEYREGMGLMAQVGGKVWPSELTQCPLDGSPLTLTPLLDGLKYFTARGLDGAFKTAAGPSPTPAWKVMALIFPFKGVKDAGELRQFEISTDDLVAAGPRYSLTWSRWDPNAPSMIDIFDFGTDGTSDGVPDGTVPVTAATTDADVEVFLVAFFEASPSIIITKTLGAAGKYPHRELYLTVRLSDGKTTFSVSHYETATEWWSSTATFTRSPKVLVTGVTDFAVSTATSNPHDAATNPTGVADANLVRLSMGTTMKLQDKGVITWPYRVDRITLRPRN